MLAALLPLIPLLTPFIPQIAQWLGGDDAEDVARQVTPAITALTGGSTDAAVVAQALTDPAKAGALAEALARIAADREKVQTEAETARLQAMLADTASARSTTVELAKANSLIAFLAPLICLMIFGLFAFVLIAEVFGYAKDLSEATRRLLDYLAIAATGYSIGSSTGSAIKDTRIGQGLNAMHEALRGSSARPAPSPPPATSGGATPARRLFPGA